MKLHTKLFVALALGGIIGILLHPYADQPAVAWAASNVLRPIGQIFLRAICMIVVRARLIARIAANSIAIAQATTRTPTPNRNPFSGSGSQGSGHAK